MASSPNPVQTLPQGTPFTIPKEGITVLIVTSLTANLTFKASAKGRAAGYPDQFSITQGLNAVMPVQGGFFEYVTLTNDAQVTVTFGMDIAQDYLNQISPLGPGGPLNTYNTTTDTLLRSIERIVPRAGVVTTATLDLSVAAGEGATVGPYNIPGSSLFIVQAGISQTTLGTTPHASYLRIADPSGNYPIYLKGAVVSAIAKKFYSARAGNYNIEYLNGDSVAHWFFLNMYVVGT